MEQINSSAMVQHMRNHQGVRPSQLDFRNGKSCFTDVISFYGKVTWVVNEGKAVDVVYLDLRKAFGAGSYSILLEKLAVHGLDNVCWGIDLLQVAQFVSYSVSCRLSLGGQSLSPRPSPRLWTANPFIQRVQGPVALARKQDPGLQDSRFSVLTL